MAYIPTEWETGDVITAAKLNNMEQGIEDAFVAPAVTSADEGDVLTVNSSGEWVNAAPSYEGISPYADHLVLANNGEIDLGNGGMKGAVVYERLQDWTDPFHSDTYLTLYDAKVLDEVFVRKEGTLTIAQDMQSATFALNDSSDELPDYDNIVKGTRIQLRALLMMGGLPMGYAILHLDAANPTGCVFSCVLVNTSLSVFAIIAVEMPYNTDTGAVTIKHIT